MGNVELFELCETIPKVQRSECLPYWNQGVICCTCGHLLVESESCQHFSQWRRDSISIPHYERRSDLMVLGTVKLRHRKSTMWPTTRGKDLKRNYEGVHDRFLRDPVSRDSQLKIGWTEEKCIQMDKLAQEDCSYSPSSEEYERYRKNWFVSLNKSGRNAPMKLRSNFRAAVTIMNRLHREPGEERAKPTPFQQYQRWHPSCSRFRLQLMAICCNRRRV